jgi:CelD/BcsL family acetyltransferase involved in cellulose biosynthesis
MRSKRAVDRGMSGWRFEWIEGTEAVLSEEFSSRWQGLVARSTRGSVFEEPAVTRAWLASKGSALGATPRFCWATSDCGAEALVPFCQLPRTGRSLWRGRLIAVGEPHFDYQNPVGAAGREGSVPWETFWAALRGELRRNGRFQEAMLLRLTKEVVGDHGDGGPPLESPYIALCPYRDCDEFLRSRPRSHRTDVRRQGRRLRELGEVEFHCHTPDDQAEARSELRRLRAAHEALWAGTPSGQLFESPGTYDFYERLIDGALPRGLVHFSVLRLSGRPISWHFGFLHRNVLHWYKPTYDRRFEEYSPGKCHLAHLVDVGIRNGWREIDLGGGAEAYKLRWTDAARQLHHWFWRDDTWKGRCWNGAQRALRTLRGAWSRGTAAKQ